MTFAGTSANGRDAPIPAIRLDDWSVQIGPKRPFVTSNAFAHSWPRCGHSRLTQAEAELGRELHKRHPSVAKIRVISQSW